MSDWKNVQYKDGKMRTSEGGGGGGSSTFAGLDDVSFNNLQNGQVPKYNSETHKWENANESGGGGTVTDVTVDGVSVVNQQGVAEITMPTPPSVPNELSDLSDVQFSNLADHQPLRYNATSQKWVNGADNYPPLIYSDEEREVGVWRDGKPLYQKTLHFNASILVNTSGWASLDSNIDGEILVSLNISALDKRYNESKAVNIRHDDANIIPRFQISGGAFQYYTNSQNFPFSGNDYDWDITIRYTKTTDTPGSGTWTTQGGYAHHYSTTEQVIGTWTDGKPLYEKTLITDSISLNIVDVNLSALSIDLIANFQGVWKRNLSSSTRQYPLMPRTETPAINSYGITYWYEDDTKNLEYSITGYSISEIVNIVMVLQYTKTTDV